MKALIFTLVLPLVAHASNQDILISRNLERAQAAFAKVADDAKKGGPNVDLLVAYGLGAGSARLYLASDRATAVYESEEDKKMADGIGMVTEWISKSFGDFAGFGRALEDEPRVGQYDDNFFKKINGAAEFAANANAKVLARNAGHPKSEETYARNLSTVSKNAAMVAWNAKRLVDSINRLPKSAVEVCFSIGFLESNLPTLKKDLAYLAVLSENFNGLGAAIDESAMSFGQSFCGPNSNRRASAGMKNAINEVSQKTNDVSEQLAAFAPPKP